MKIRQQLREYGSADGYRPIPPQTSVAEGQALGRWKGSELQGDVIVDSYRPWAPVSDRRVLFGHADLAPPQPVRPEEGCARQTQGECPRLGSRVRGYHARETGLAGCAVGR